MGLTTQSAHCLRSGMLYVCAAKTPRTAPAENMHKLLKADMTRPRAPACTRN